MPASASVSQRPGAAREEELRAAVEAAVESLAEEITSLRTLIVELRPAALDEYGAAAAIESLAERTAARQGIEVDVHLDLAWERGERADAPHPGAREHALPPRAGVADQRRAPRRRAAASQIDVTERDGSLDVTVTDDGRGFDVESRSTGFGLIGMRERVKLAAGELEIETGRSGTTVRARLPVRRLA